jgi:hypothetical protein
MSREAPQPVIATCSICVESFNRTARKRVTCESCETDICSKCIKRYLSENVQQPNCMQCRALYTTQFLDTNFSKKFRKETLQNIRDIVLVEREKQLLPQLMHRANAYKELMALKIETTALWSEHYKLQTEKNHLKQEVYKVITTEGSDERKLQELKEGLIVLETTVMKVYAEIENKQAKEAKYSNAYRHGVPLDVHDVVQCITPNCKGYLDNDYMCRLCSVHVCKECHQEMSGNHECSAEDIETVKAIKNETHPCPNCQTRIFKIDGCDQIFCTQCHTAFSWATGKIETGRIHNPHYYQWIRTRNVQVPREAGDVPCGGFPSFHIIEDKLFKLDVSIANVMYVREILKFGKMVQTREVAKYPVTTGRSKEMDLYSIQYLAGYLSERRWRNYLYAEEILREMNTERRLLYDMLLAVLIDYMNSIQNITKKDDIDNMLIELEEFRRYYNACVGNLDVSFPDAKFKCIRFDWSRFV